MFNEHFNPFAVVDVTEDITGRQIRDLIKIHYSKLKGTNKSFKTANKSWLHLTFSEEDCTMRFYYRSWRYVNVTFNVNRHVI